MPASLPSYGHNSRAQHPRARLTAGQAGPQHWGSVPPADGGQTQPVCSTCSFPGTSAVPSQAFLSPPLLQNPLLEAPRHRLGSPELMAVGYPLSLLLQRHSVQRVRGLVWGGLGVKGDSTILDTRKAISSLRASVSQVQNGDNTPASSDCAKYVHFKSQG